MIKFNFHSEYSNIILSKCLKTQKQFSIQGSRRASSVGIATELACNDEETKANSVLDKNAKPIVQGFAKNGERQKKGLVKFRRVGTSPPPKAQVHMTSTLAVEEKNPRRKFSEDGENHCKIVPKITNLNFMSQCVNS